MRSDHGIHFVGGEQWLRPRSERRPSHVNPLQREESRAGEEIKKNYQPAQPQKRDQNRAARIGHPLRNFFRRQTRKQRKLSRVAPSRPFSSRRALTRSRRH